MTGTVVSLAQFKEDQKPHAGGDAFCVGCNHEWVAVAPVGTVALACPECKAHKGRFKFEFAPNPGEMVRTCNCGNQLFYLTMQGHLCANCGVYQSY